MPETALRPASAVKDGLYVSYTQKKPCQMQGYGRFSRRPVYAAHPGRYGTVPG